MSTDSDLSDQKVIRLTIPAAAEYLRLARLAAADVGSRAGLDFEEIEDLRIAVDELSHALVAPGTEGDVMSLTFAIRGATVTVDGEGPPGATHRVVIQSELSRTIIAAVVDEHALHTDGDIVRFFLRKESREGRTGGRETSGAEG